MICNYVENIYLLSIKYKKINCIFVEDFFFYKKMGYQYIIL